MPIHTIDAAEQARLTDSACHLFIARNPDYWPSPANSQRLISFVHSQLGMTLDEYNFPVTVDMWQAAYDHIKKTSWFLERPVEEEIQDPAVVKERAAQQKVRDDHAARIAAETIARDKMMPLAELGAKVSQQNSDFREQRDRNLLPIRTPGLESRPLSTITLGMKAAARANVALAHPEITDRNSAEFSRLYALELQKLRQQ